MQQILDNLKSGNFIIVTDHKNREDEADLVIAAEFITKEKIAFMLDHCSGIICVPMSKKRIDKIGIPIINDQILNNESLIANQNDKTAPFTIAVDSKECHTGISAKDRYLTIKKLCDNNATINDFSAPGHMFPLYAHPDGLKARKGHTEAAVELVKLAGLKHIAVICELMNSSANLNNRDDLDETAKKEKLGTMMKDEDIKAFSEKYKLRIIKIEDIS